MIIKEELEHSHTVWQLPTDVSFELPTTKLLHILLILKLME